MGSKQIRLGQVIAPFGPGSLYTDRRGVPHVVCGLDHWFQRYDSNRGLVQCENKEEFELFEPRLSALLRVERFFSPPDFRAVRRGAAAPPNSSLYLPALRFPSWYRHSSTGRLKKFNVEQAVIPRAQDGRWMPVRFVAVCEGGHLTEFPWREWISCDCADGGELYLHDRGGSELSSIRVECRSCPEGSPGRRGATLSGTTSKGDRDAGEHTAFHSAGVHCPGDRIWLGEGAEEPGCAHELVGALINQTNLYFPRTISAVRLPDLQQHDDAVIDVRNLIEADGATAGVAKTLWKMGSPEQAVDIAVGALTKLGHVASRDQIREALRSLIEGSTLGGPAAAQPAMPEVELLSFRREEFNVIRGEVNDPKRSPRLRVIPSELTAKMSDWVTRVNLVEKLCETRVFYGFDRLEAPANPLDDMPDSAMRALFRNAPSTPLERWLPAVEVFGEGIYLELNEERIAQWQEEQKEWISERLNDAFLIRLAAVGQTLPPMGQIDRQWASKYLLIHTISHCLINQLVFECGYSTASLRERLFVSSDAVAPMAGILIYTAAGDSEGTMGGLVRLGRGGRLEAVVDRALTRAYWCSADPICSENLGGQGSRLANIAACHACVLLPETSCETINQGLDRGMLLGIPESRTPGFFTRLIAKEIGTAEA